MKTIKTIKIGTIEYSEDKIITFKQGIPGFETEKEFIIYQENDENPFAYLQSVNNEGLTFMITNPFLFFKDYEFKLDEASKEELKIKKQEDVYVWGLISLSTDIKNTTINLAAPIVININSNIGKQYIIHSQDYQTKTLLFPQAVEQGGK